MPGRGSVIIKFLFVTQVFQSLMHEEQNGFGVKKSFNIVNCCNLCQNLNRCSKLISFLFRSSENGITVFLLLGEILGSYISQLQMNL